MYIEIHLVALVDVCFWRLSRTIGCLRWLTAMRSVGKNDQNTPYV